MYNQDIKIYRIDKESGDDLTKADIKKAIEWHKTKIVPTMDKLENYGDGYNTAIKEKEDQARRAAGIPNNTKSFGYGQNIKETYTNYLISNPATYSAEDSNFIEEIRNGQKINDDHTESMKIVTNIVRMGIGGKIFYNEIGGVEDPKVYLKYASVDPREFVAIYNYDIKPKIIAVVRYYGISEMTSEGKTATDQRVSVYTESNIYEYSSKDSSKGEPKPHLFGQIPFSVYGGGDYSGAIYSVLDQIDMHDSIQNSNLNELQRFELAVMLFFGVTMDKAKLEQGKEMGAYTFPPGTGSESVKYLTKDVNAEFNINSRDNSKKEIHDLSGIIDYNDPGFAAESGVALQWKMLGFNTRADQAKDKFLSGEQKAMDVMSQSMDMTGWKSRPQYLTENPEKAVDIKLNKNIPEDVLRKIEIATAAKLFGIPEEKLLKILPEEITGGIDLKDLEKEIISAREEQAKKEEEAINRAVEETEENDGVE